MRGHKKSLKTISCLLVFADWCTLENLCLQTTANMLLGCLCQKTFAYVTVCHSLQNDKTFGCDQTESICRRFLHIVETRRVCET